MPNNSRNLLVVVETIFPCTFLWYLFSLVVVSPIPSRQFHVTAAWSQCRATLSDHRLFHHRSTRHLQRLHQLSLCTSCVSITVCFEVLKAMSVAGRVSCAGSTPTPSVLLTRTGHRVYLVELVG